MAAPLPLSSGLFRPNPLACSFVQRLTRGPNEDEGVIECVVHRALESVALVKTLPAGWVRNAPLVRSCPCERSREGLVRHRPWDFHGMAVDDDLYICCRAQECRPGTHVQRERRNVLRFDS